MNPCFRSKLYTGLKRLGALISRVDRCSGVDIAIGGLGTLTSRADYRSDVDIAAIDFWTGRFSSIAATGV